MPDQLPRKFADWKQAAKCNNIDHTQSLSAGTTFPSGSKFNFEHFLRLRVLYIEEQRPKSLGESPGFPRERLEEMKRTLKEDTDASFLRSFLQDRGKIVSDWNVKNAKKAGVFAVALEHLHLIAKRGVRILEDYEDISDLKIISSPRKSRSMTKSGAHYHQSSVSTMPPSTPTPKPQKSHFESLILNDNSDDFDISSLTIDSAEEVVSAPNSDLRRARDLVERSDFSPGDEQTVNAALVALIMALSWSLGYTGRAHHDRARLSIPRDAETDLYAACVDGLIMHLNEDKYNGFMEAKRDFRGQNQSVRRQIAAQMAAFIFEQDVVLAEKETEKETRKAPKGKGKKAEAKSSSKGKGKKVEDKEDRIKDKDGGDQER